MSTSIVNSIQLPMFAPPGTLVPKIIHSGSNWVGQPYVYTDDSSVAVRGADGQGILIDNTFGTTITGPTAFFESLENIHFSGGYWTINPVLIESVGSSAAIPMPFLVPTTPRILSAAQTLSSSVSTLQAADPTITS